MTDSTADNVVTVNVAWCKYGVVRDAIQDLGYAIIDDQEDTTTKYNAKWLDVGVGVDKVMSLGSHAKINHWPGMSCLHTKNGLAATLRPLQRLFPKAYGHVHPRTWLLPEEMADFQSSLTPDEEPLSGGRRKRKRVFIVKPAASCQGRGIHLARAIQDLQDPRSASIAQEYEARPFLVEGLKFDLRIYVLLSSVDPLRLWLFDEGLVRFATTPYAPPKGGNLKNVTQHLTNYAINKDSENFVQNSGGIVRGDVGSKRTLSWFRTWLDANGYSSTRVWGRIVDLIIKVFVAGQPHLARTYRSAVPAEGGSMRCFEVLGLDVLLDSNLQPWMLEVNHSPSLSCDSQLDTQIKIKLIKETLQILRLRAGDLKRATEVAAAAAKRRLYGGTGNATSFDSNSSSVIDTSNIVSNPRPQSSKAQSSKAEEASATSKRAHAFRDLVASVLKDNAKDLLKSGIRSAVSTAKPSTPPPPHAEATAPLFAHLASPIPEEHALHEAKICKGYRLIFPPPNPAFIEESVFARGAAGAKIMQDAIKRSKSIKSSKQGNAAIEEEDDVDDEESDDEIRGSFVQPPASSGSSMTSKPSSRADSSQSEYQLAKPAVFRVFYTPWDVSREEYAFRIQRYAYFLAAAQELYALNYAASAIGGKKAGEATVLSSIGAIASSVTEADVASEGKSPTKYTHTVVLPGLELPQKEPELKTVLMISRIIRALSVAAAERAASSTSKRSIAAPLTTTPGLNTPAWDSGRGDSESNIANRILTALRNLALRDGESLSAFNEAKERLMETDAKKAKKGETVVVLIKQEEERPPLPPQSKRTFDADLALVSKRSALIRAATTATNAAVLAAATVAGSSSSTRMRPTQVSETLPINRSQGSSLTTADLASPVVGIASLADVGPVGLRDSLIPAKRGFRGSMNGASLQRPIGPAQLVGLVVPSPHAHAAYKRLLREATVKRTELNVKVDLGSGATSARIDSPVKKSLINAVRPSSASGRIAVNGGASAGEVIALLQQSRVARSAALFGL
jgi:hypothetical protein